MIVIFVTNLICGANPSLLKRDKIKFYIYIYIYIYIIYLFIYLFKKEIKIKFRFIIEYGSLRDFGP